MRLRVSRDWATAIYETNSRIYQPILESGLKSAPREVNGIIKILRKCGVPSGSRILDLSCGIGRHSVNLAKRGYRVTGVDPSRTFLNRARELALHEGVSHNTRFVRGRFSNLTAVLSKQDGAERFGGIIVMDSSIGVTGRDEDDLKLFKDLRSLALPGAPLVVDIYDREALAAAYQWTRIEDFPDNLVRIWTALSPPGSLVHTARWQFYRRQPDGSLAHLLTIRIRVRHYSIAELGRLARKAGWGYEASFGSLKDLHRFTHGDYRAIAVFRNAG